MKGEERARVQERWRMHRRGSLDAPHLGGRSPTRVRTGPRTALLLLFGWLVLGTIGYVLIEGYTWFDAVYMTVITLSTVGFEEVRPLSPAGRAFTSVLIVAGLGTVLYALTRLGQGVIEGELLSFVGRRRIMGQLDRLDGHVILCGYGRTAKPIVEGLQEDGVPVCVIERNGDLEVDLQAVGAPYVIGDATEEEVLELAGLARARSVLALLPSDADNLYLTMTVKGLASGAKVIARASDEKAEAKLRRGGADDVVSPYKMAGHRVIQAIVRPTVLEFVELVTGRHHLHLGLEEIVVDEGSRLADRSLADAAIRRQCGAIIVAVQQRDGSMTFNPDASFTLRAGHKLIALGRREDLDKLEGLAGSGG